MKEKKSPLDPFRKVHWQYKKLTPDAFLQAEMLVRETGLTTRHVRFLQWAKEYDSQFFASTVAKEFFKEPDFRKTYAYQEARVLVEAMAVAGYLTRGRTHGKSKRDGEKFVVTNYRLSSKAKAQLRRYEPGSSSSAPSG